LADEKAVITKFGKNGIDFSQTHGIHVGARRRIMANAAHEVVAIIDFTDGYQGNEAIATTVARRIEAVALPHLVNQRQNLDARLMDDDIRTQVSGQQFLIADLDDGRCRRVFFDDAGIHAVAAHLDQMAYQYVVICCHVFPRLKCCGKLSRYLLKARRRLVPDHLKENPPMFSFRNRPGIMGILNVTPDSFSDGGLHDVPARAASHAFEMMADGADIIDIGGESTRPGALPVADDEQIRRVVPVIRAIRTVEDGVSISIDTQSSRVAEAALNAGADLINDISAGLGDVRMLPFAASVAKPIILMHMQGTPQTMQDKPQYDNVVQEVLDALQRRIDAALAAGVKAEHIAIDPGIGFGKRRQDNIDLLAHLHRFVDLGFPVLLGTSRKRFMGAICQVTEPKELVTATAVTTALGVMAGVTMFRVHDVKANRQAADVAWAIKQAI